MRGFDAIGLHVANWALAYHGGINTSINTRSYTSTTFTSASAGASAGIGSGFGAKPNTFDNILMD